MLTVRTRLLKVCNARNQFFKHVVRSLTPTWHQDLSSATEQSLKSSTTC